MTIKELAEAVRDVVGYQGEIGFDTTKPDGTPRKLMDISCLKGLGWQAPTALKVGLAEAYRDFLGRHGQEFKDVLKDSSLHARDM